MLKKSAGFTLLEIMIVVAIVGILAAIVYPSYQDALTKSRRADGAEMLLDLANRMERCFTADGVYDGAASAGNTCPANGDVVMSNEQFYQITVVSAPSTFTLTAVPQGVQATHDAADCPTLTIDQTGAKTPDPDANRCWGK